ncbi:MAG TPA: hypothetical protein VNT51_06965 [Miltoncostaeaceae bacterium]|nr:hypothetical protein [Miltoncostaeaceae bacterium]
MDAHNRRERVFRPACDRAGVEAAPKDGRTSYCSLLIHEGRSLAYVAASMGNSPRVISDHYLHVLRAAELGARMPHGERCVRGRVRTISALSTQSAGGDTCAWCPKNDENPHG